MKYFWLAAAIGPVLTTTPAASSGFQINQHDARAIASSYAGVASTGGEIGFLAYTPASMRGLRQPSFTFGAVAALPRADYRDADAEVLGGLVPVAGRTAGGDATPDIVVPTFAAAAPVRDGWSIGVSAHVPFGLATEYERDWVGRYHAVESRVESLNLALSSSIDIGERVTLGASFRAQYLSVTLSNAVDAGGIAAALGSTTAVPTEEDVFAEVSGDDWGYGYAVGAMFQPVERLTLGVSYVSSIEHDIEGDADFDLQGSDAGALLQGFSGLFEDTAAFADTQMPGTLALSFSAQATAKTTLHGSMRRTFWSVFDEVRVRFANPAQPDDVLQVGYEDSWAFSLGAEHAVTDRLTLRLGLLRDFGPSSDQERTPRIPDDDRWSVSAGAGWRASERVSIDGAFAYFRTGDVALEQRGDRPENAARGSVTAELTTDAFVASARAVVRF